VTRHSIRGAVPDQPAALERVCQIHGRRQWADPTFRAITLSFC
jgi:hypothetical protein